MVRGKVLGLVTVRMASYGTKVNTRTVLKMVLGLVTIEVTKVLGSKTIKMELYGNILSNQRLNGSKRGNKWKARVQSWLRCMRIPQTQNAVMDTLREKRCGSKKNLKRAIINDTKLLLWFDFILVVRL